MTVIFIVAGVLVAGLGIAAFWSRELIGPALGTFGGIWWTLIGLTMLILGIIRLAGGAL